MLHLYSRRREEERGGHEMNGNNYTEQIRPDPSDQLTLEDRVVHSTYLLSLLEGFVGDDLGPRLSGGVGSTG